MTKVAQERSVFSMRLSQARERAGFSQAELGRRAGFDPSGASPRVNQYERGRHMPDLNTIKRLANVLQVPVPFLFAEDEQLAKLLLLWADLTAADQRRLIRELEDQRNGTK